MPYTGDKTDVTALVKYAQLLEGENERLRYGLRLIQEAGSVHGGAWCVAQAKGFLEDLDFDQYPETGKAPAQPQDAIDMAKAQERRDMIRSIQEWAKSDMGMTLSERHCDELADRIIAAKTRGR